MLLGTCMTFLLLQTKKEDILNTCDQTQWPQLTSNEWKSKPLRHLIKHLRLICTDERVTQVSNNMRANMWGQNFYICMNYSFKSNH